MTLSVKRQGPTAMTGPKPLQTIRAWVPSSRSDIMAYIREKGLEDAVLEAVQLDDCHSASDVVSAGRLEKSILVDLAVVEQEIPRVRRHFSCFSSGLNDLSLVIIDPDSTDPITRCQLRYYSVYGKYLRQNVKASQSGNAPSLVLEWYRTRLDGISVAMMQNR